MVSAARHALTIDLEDWHQLLHRRATGEIIAPTPAVVAATYRLLDMLDDAGVRATFFTVGMVAERYPDLIREVARRGHEIGSHSHHHLLIGSMTRDAFTEEMKHALGFLRDLTGQPVRGFRAPEFSVGHLGHWCFDVLAGLSVDYDSSVFPLPGSRYGIPDAPTTPFDIDTPNGPIREFPLATWRLLGLTLPVAGGTYYRLLPVNVIRRAFRDIEGEGRTIVLYFHPYEFHDAWLWLPSLKWHQKLRPAAAKYSILHNSFTPFIMRRLRALLAEFPFGPLGELARERSQANSVEKQN